MKVYTLSEWNNRKKKKDEVNESGELKVYSYDEWAEKKGIQPLTSSKKEDDDIAPVREHGGSSGVLGAEKEEKKSGILGNIELTKKDNLFSDGWQAGDVAKSLAANTGKLVTGVTKGALGLGEGISDLILYGAAGASDLVGAKDTAEWLKKEAQANSVDDMFAPVENYLDKYSTYGRSVEALNEGIGQVATTVGGGAALKAAGLGAKGITAVTQAILGTSAAGSGMSEAYQSGATDEEAATYGAITGTSAVLTEMLFGGIGKTINAVGISKGLSQADDILAKKVTEKINNVVAKNMVSFGIKSGAEGFEEILDATASIAGKKLTYMSEEELSDLIRDENLLENFLVGTMTSAAMQSGYLPGTYEGSLRESNKTGKDFVTGNTQNEQKVIDFEVERRISEQETDEKKLTKREIATIKEQVSKDLERGYISTDSIESALGGETYKTLKQVTENEESLRNEYNELNKLKQSEMTGEQLDRRAELKEQLEKIETNSQKAQLQAQVRNEVYNIAKADRLAESYNEERRKGEQYNDDPTRYKSEAAQQTIQNVINSGIVQNTNRAHDFIDFMARISEDKGYVFDVTTSERLAESKKNGNPYNLEADPEKIQAFVSGKDKKIFVNLDANKSLNSLVGHEITHTLEANDGYEGFQKVLFDYAATKGELKDRIASLKKRYDGLDADMKMELTADLVGDYLFTDSDFIRELSVKDRNIFQKIYDEIKYLCKLATAGSREAREIEKVKKEFAKLYRETAASVEKADITLSLSGIENGIEVYETSEETKKLSYKDRKQKLLDKMRNEFAGRTAKFTKNGEVYYAFYDKGSLNKGVHGDKKSDKKGYKAKINIGADGNYIELAENALYTKSSVESGKDNRFHDDAKTWDYFVKTIKSDGNYFDVLINVKDTGNEQFVYDITLKEADSLPEQFSSYDGSSSASNNSIPQNSENSSGIDEKTRYSASDDIDRQNKVNAFDDLKLSMQDGKRKEYGNYNVYGKDIRFEAPVNPDIEPAKETTTYSISESEPTQDYPTVEQAKPKNEPRKEPEKVKRKSVTEDAPVARILTEEPEAEKKKSRFWSQAAELTLDKGFVFENLSKKTKNRELEAKWNYIRYADGKAQDFIGNGAEGVRALNDLRKEVESKGIKQDLFDYVYHLHNIDRMNLAKKARAKERQLLRENPMLEELSESDKVKDIEKMLETWSEQISIDDILADEKLQKKIDTFYSEETRSEAAKDLQEKLSELLKLRAVKNKPVFGGSVTAKVSQKTVSDLEAKNPELKRYANELYAINNYLRKMLIDGGVISQETSDLWDEMYPHYVPIRRAGDHGLNVNVPLDTGRTGVNVPVKRATGGNSDILPLFDTMAQRVLQTYRAVATNRFGVELKNTLETMIEVETADADSIIEGTDQNEELLQKGKNGRKPTFTVFENGERVTFEITDDMYDALKPTNEMLAHTIKPLNKIMSAHRGLLTEYNPAFLASNAIKDAQDVLINSQHPLKTAKAFPKAVKETISRGNWYKEYLENGGAQDTYFDKKNNTFQKEMSKFEKVAGAPFRGISKANNFIERLPRLAEYIASRESGRSIEVSMLDSARVTTNFAAGGDLTKFANRNGATFLNASVQGVMQQVRNVREAKMNGLKGVVQLAAKYTVAGLPVVLLNSLMWDDDEEYEELSDYVKQNYYVVAKYGDGKFIRIPKGRMLAVIQNGFEQMKNLATGDDEADLKEFLKLAVGNLAPNNPVEDNIIAPIIQQAKNTTWYDGDLVPTRLQDVPAEEQYDESIDEISKWLGEKLHYSPYKINYMLDQYSGGLGDSLLPFFTPEAETGDDNAAIKFLAPIRDKFVTDSVLKNQNVSDFYDKKNELAVNANSSKATEEDTMAYKYFNSKNKEISDLYKEKREIQSREDLSDSEKYYLARELQKKINALAKEALNDYSRVNIEGSYSTVGDKQYRQTEDGWEKITDDQAEKQEKVTSTLGITPAEYWGNKEEYNYAYDNPEKYAVSKAVGGYDAYRQYSKELYDIKSDKDANGKSITGSRKEKVIEYINKLDADYGTKIILLKSEYPSDDTHNDEIVDYLNSKADLTHEDITAILKELGAKVKSDGTVDW